MTDDDPLQELRRIRDEMAKRFNYDVKALGEYIRSVPLLPGQKWYEPPEAKTKGKKGVVKNSASKRKKLVKPAAKAMRRKTSTHA